ncbi:phosphatase PAP2 family protein [Telmatobacter sp. DSM 110680]|uniref:Phosphatase PAP2 family protein n=1 Tax=Telmatobacter sp. DSM 110680 TaxID=3036704 RepID=A0AAU7DH31_9BACT
MAETEVQRKSAPGELHRTWFRELSSSPIFVSWRHALRHPSFNIKMAYAGTAILVVSFVGCKATQIHVPNVGTMFFALVCVGVAVLSATLYLEEKGKLYWKDLIAVIFWAIFFTYTLNFPVAIAARLGLGFELRDALLVRLDQYAGVRIPVIVAWSLRNPLGILASGSYFLLFPYMRAAILVTALAGKAQAAKQFLLANVIGFAVGLPCFALIPAVGPWYGYHVAARPDQIASQATLFLLRHPGPCEYHLPTGIVCFPSFHVFWAILCAQALWVFPSLRIPASILSGLIIFSTVTTGEHYISDVFAGALLAAVAAFGSGRLDKLTN